MVSGNLIGVADYDVYLLDKWVLEFKRLEVIWRLNCTHPSKPIHAMDHNKMLGVTLKNVFTSKSYYLKAYLSVPRMLQWKVP